MENFIEWSENWTENSGLLSKILNNKQVVLKSIKPLNPSMMYHNNYGSMKTFVRRKKTFMMFILPRLLLLQQTVS